MGSLKDAIEALKTKIERLEEQFEKEMVEGLTQTDIPVESEYVTRTLNAIDKQKRLITFLERRLAERGD